MKIWGNMGIVLIPLAAWLNIILFPQIGWSAVDLDYRLTIEDPESGEATVRMSVSNLSSDIFEVEEHGIQDFYINVLSLSARDAEGAGLTVEHFPDSGTCNSYFNSCADLWRIHCAGKSSIIIEYVVKPGVKHRKYDWPVGLIGPHFAMFSGERVFLVPRPEDGSFDSVRVSFVLPLGWAAYTPWPQEGGKYNPFLAINYTSKKTLDGLCLSTLTLGQFNYSTYMAGATEVRIAAYSTWPVEIKSHLVQSSRQIFEYLTSVWGASVGDIYLAIWTPTTEDGKRIGGGEWFNSRGDCVYIHSDGSFYVDWHEFAHQVFHRWGGFGTWNLAREGWFIEGPDVFYEWKIGTRFLLTGHYGDMEEEIGQYHEQYLEEYVNAGLDAPVAVRVHDGSNYPTDYFIRYYKAAMVNFLIAKEIVRLTNGQYTFDNLLQSLLRKYQEHQLSDWYSETVKAELSILTGSDWTQFFDDYVYGTTTLPMEWAFDDDDDDGLSNANEIGRDSNPWAIDTDGDGILDGEEVIKGTSPLLPFGDVPSTHWAFSSIKHLYDTGVTNGCDTNLYCPDRIVTRAQMGVFLERAIRGPEFVPAAGSGLFNDIPSNYWARDWIEQLYHDGITGGCEQQPLRYCPENPVTRGQMAVFLLRAKYGPDYFPHKAEGIFNDVDSNHWARDWIEQLHRLNITTGCKTDPLRYCPEEPVTRAQMAVFLTRTFTAW